MKTQETNKSKEDLSKEVKDIKKNQLKVLEIKHTITKIKNLWNVFKSRMERSG